MRTRITSGRAPLATLLEHEEMAVDKAVAKSHLETKHARTDWWKSMVGRAAKRAAIPALASIANPGFLIGVAGAAISAAEQNNAEDKGTVRRAIDNQLLPPAKYYGKPNYHKRHPLEARAELIAKGEILPQIWPDNIQFTRAIPAAASLDVSLLPQLQALAIERRLLADTGGVLNGEPVLQRVEPEDVSGLIQRCCPLMQVEVTQSLSSAHEFLLMGSNFTETQKPGAAIQWVERELHHRITSIHGGTGLVQPLKGEGLPEDSFGIYAQRSHTSEAIGVRVETFDSAEHVSVTSASTRSTTESLERRAQSVAPFELTSRATADTRSGVELAGAVPGAAVGVVTAALTGLDPTGTLALAGTTAYFGYRAIIDFGNRSMGRSTEQGAKLKAAMLGADALQDASIETRIAAIEALEKQAV